MRSEPTSSTSPSASASPTVSVKPPVPGLKPVVAHIRDFAYVLAAPVVIVGQPIEIVNDDAAAHTWSAAPRVGWAYTSGNLEKGSRRPPRASPAPAATDSSAITTPRCRR